MVPFIDLIGVCKHRMAGQLSLLVLGLRRIFCLQLRRERGALPVLGLPRHSNTTTIATTTHGRDRGVRGHGALRSLSESRATNR